MIHPEENTIKAVNELKSCFPYAASLLVYVVIESKLKRYILKHRECNFRSATGKDFNFANYIGKSDDAFIKGILTHLTLWHIESLGIAKGVPKDRNDLMHSNLYISEEKDLPDRERQNMNIQHFEKAKAHLKRVFIDYSDIPIEEKNGRLFFRGDRMNKEYEYVHLLSQESRATILNGKWLGTVKLEETSENPILSCPNVIEYLNELGSKGWELVSVNERVLNNIVQTIYYLKKEK